MNAFAGGGLAVCAAVLVLSLTPGTQPEIDRSGPEPGAVASVEYRGEGFEGWKRLDDDPASDSSAEAKCDVTIRWQTSTADVDPFRSRVRTSNGLWVRLGRAWGGELFVGKPILVRPYSDDPMNSLYWMQVELKRDCDKWRRYRFRLEGRTATNGNTRFVGIERELYYPSKGGFTRKTNIDLGYLDLCIADGNRCDGAYYPGGNSTPWPRTR